MSSRRLALLLLLLISGCADLERGEPSPPAPDAGATTDGAVTATDGGATVSFARDVYPILVDRCARCHSSSGEASDTSFILGNDPARDLASVRKLVDPDDPAGSRLLVKAAGTGHGGGAILAPSSAEYQTILQWISQGSPP